jgi:uncharacterized membrane-anchored protein
MPIFARFHGGHAGHGGRPLHWSDFVSTVNGQPHYHLIPLLLLGAVGFMILLFLWALVTHGATAEINVSNRALAVIGVILLLIAVACWILVQFPPFSLF